MENRELLLEIKNVSKQFPGVKALDDVSMNLYKGEVVALLGENGAGKSTLVKILSGAYKRDSGEIILDGEVLPKAYSTMEGRRLGISIIYQELSLLNELKVMENIFLNHEPKKIKGVIDFKKMRELSKIQLKKLNADYINPDSKVGDLSLPQKQLVEIAKALALDCKVLIMDEPTTSLTNEESEQLFGVIEGLRASGISVIYISHRMSDIFRICDRAIVMRDGKVVGEQTIEGTTQEELVELMSGNIVGFSRKEGYNFDYTDKKVLLKLKNVSDGNFIDNINLDVFENEVLGVGGLIGAKRTELFKMVCGVDKMHGGTVEIEGKEVNIKTPNEAIKSKIGYLSENRKEDGLSLGITVRENCIHCNFEGASKNGIVSYKKINEIADNYVQKLKIKGKPYMRVENLSGGNQQKVAISKWLFAECNILVFDEPTRGIDVAAKAEIHNLIREFARGPGHAAVVISSEVNELLAVSDRVVVMSK
ncbi:MAG: sugar ABC transporter ATP-binding protein, partial [Christensenellaceae bacterium]|nr:sugar ABC transporter ATP-binding protein [Christensenellaceae bacterium]